MDSDIFFCSLKLAMLINIRIIKCPKEPKEPKEPNLFSIKGFSRLSGGGDVSDVDPVTATSPTPPTVELIARAVPPPPYEDSGEEKQERLKLVSGNVRDHS